LFFGPFELENSQQPLSKLNLRDGSVIHLVWFISYRLLFRPYILHNIALLFKWIPQHFVKFRHFRNFLRVIDSLSLILISLTALNHTTFHWRRQHFSSTCVYCLSLAHCR
jgi:hypothetical protein